MPNVVVPVDPTVAPAGVITMFFGGVVMPQSFVMVIETLKVAMFVPADAGSLAAAKTETMARAAPKIVNFIMSLFP
jgi:hypothetical protein